MHEPSPVQDYLDSLKIPYTAESHPRTYTSLDTAEREHVSGKRFAKTVVVMADGRLILAIVPAHLKVNLGKLSRLCGRSPLRLATEEEFVSHFPDCEVGAMPPFGHRYDLDVYIDDDVAVAPELTFNACTHEETLTVSGKDFLRAAEAVVGDFSEER